MGLEAAGREKRDGGVVERLKMPWELLERFSWMGLAVVM